MKLPIYQVDAFAQQPFEGNPAAVMPLQQWLPDRTMQAIAAENNLAETAFFVPAENGFHIRWFTPTVEVKLCGHATLAAAFVLFTCRGYREQAVRFDSLSGPLTVSRDQALLTLDFPAQRPVAAELCKPLVEGLGSRPSALYRGEDYMAVFEREEDVARIEPDHRILEHLDRRGVIVTAPSRHYDFVARFFAPRCGIPEDPVTGSAYTQLMPYWSDRLGRPKLRARQISPRGGTLFCEMNGERVLISGYAVMYMEGCVELEG